ncbi:hypothetical protein SAMN02745866_01862 [Alteromonadaceae bacterium Bs31]|nr:hypothetical protein SAMN02745866_01862 [Alteromonadaceae bacterium Bs31]
MLGIKKASLNSLLSLLALSLIPERYLQLVGLFGLE